MFQRVFKGQTLWSLVNAATFPSATSFEILKLPMDRKKSFEKGWLNHEIIHPMKTLLKANIIVHLLQALMFIRDPFRDVIIRQFIGN